MWEIDVYYQIVSNLLFFGTAASTAYCCYRLAKAFMRQKRRAWRVGAAYFLTMTVLYYIPWVISNFCAYLCGVLAAFLVMYLLERENVEQKIFLGSTFFSLRWLSSAMEVTLSQTADPLFSQIPGIQQNEWALFIVFTLRLLIDRLLNFALMFLAVQILLKAYIYKREGMTKRELLLLFIPSLSSALNYAVLSSYQALYERNTGKRISDAYGGYSWLYLFYYLISLLSILTVTVIFQSLKNRQEEEKRNRLLLEQTEEVKRHIAEVERLYSDIRSLKHDMGNHLLTLEQLYLRKEWEQAGEYLRQMKEQINEAVPGIQSGHPVTDVILSERKKEAEEKGIDFQCAFHYPEGSGINAFDLSILLNNAIANALEGAQASASPSIQILSYRKKNAYLLEISNSFAGEILFNEENGLPLSSKKAPGHGLGLANIQKVAQKYCGDIDITLEENRFTLDILLMAR